MMSVDAAPMYRAIPNAPGPGRVPASSEIRPVTALGTRGSARVEANARPRAIHEALTLGHPSGWRPRERVDQSSSTAYVGPRVTGVMYSLAFADDAFDVALVYR